MSTEATADLAVLGLGVMGANLARNFHSRGWTVGVYNRSRPKLDEFMTEHGDPKFVGTDDLQQLVASVKRPRRLVLMVTAGRAVDALLESLLPLLEDGDVVVDGGNSHFPDTDRRVEAVEGTGVTFVGMGVSGGEEGALKGPSMMPGGTRESWERLRPLLESAAAVSDSGPCVTWCGNGSAGHYVKMVHNGIEYGDMQLIAETWAILKAAGRSPTQIREVFERWNAGRLSSFLIEITSHIVAARDPEGDGPIVDQILDVAGQKGTGRWTSVSAITQGVPLSTVTAAVDARALSAQKALRVRAESVLGGGTGALDVSEADLESALYAAKLMSYTQGFQLLRSASDEKGYESDLAAISRIWKAGCIIRASFLDRVYDAFQRDPSLPLLALDPTFAAELKAALPGWRRVVAASVAAGIPIPAMSASLAWFDSIRLGRGTACVIQAQRDYFGAHTYKRLDAPDVSVHTEWAELEQL
ncbi:MAG: NADP-dependent phosphogluconate dehydrogenase [Alphaproteobacteria bacterium]|nr:NADP-dependent phosphogluconate dehydrogenase [Alphaproteobacteria bacterium]